MGSSVDATQEALHIIGGGLAGTEAAWQVARAGLRVVVHEMRPLRQTPAHVTAGLAELVCSNSFRSDDWRSNAVGLLHAEMRRAGSLILRAADANKVPAGGALAVDRLGFSASIEAALSAEPLIEIRREEVTSLPPKADVQTIIATGPLTSPDLARALADLTGTEALSFFDAIAPIVYKDSIDLSRAWFQSRYDKVGPAGDTAAYINCPLDRPGYDAFIGALLAGEKTTFREWERDTPYFEGCLPIEVMAERGPNTLRFGPMKPVGLTNPHTNQRPYAVVQLRQDNTLGTLYNIVGFQTKLKHSAQREVFRMIPGLEQARFARFGGLHRNTFIDSPRLLDECLRLKIAPQFRFAGQITGVEGYVESAAMGLLAGRFAAAERLGYTAPPPPPPTTALGALLAHITGGHLGDAQTPNTEGRSRVDKSFQPMNINFGLFPPLTEETVRRHDAPGKTDRKNRGKARKQALAERALSDLDRWLGASRRAAE